MKSFKQILNEMPYIMVQDDIFDLELEKIKSKEQFISELKYIFSGKTQRDKYGGRIRHISKNKKKRDELKQEILDDPMVGMLIKKWDYSIEELKALLKTL